MGIYNNSFLSIDVEELKEKDNALLNKLVSREDFSEEDYPLLDEIEDIYMARRLIVLLLKDRKDYKDIAEDALKNLKELTRTILLTVGGTNID